MAATTEGFLFPTNKSTKKPKEFVFRLSGGGGDGEEESLPDYDSYYDFSKKVTVKKWRKQPVVGIRVWEEDTIPTKKGVMLSREGWANLALQFDTLQEYATHEDTDSKIFLQADTNKEKPTFVFASIFKPGNDEECCYTLSNFCQPDKEKKELFPTKRGIRLKQCEFDRLLILTDQIEEALDLVA